MCAFAVPNHRSSPNRPPKHPFSTPSRVDNGKGSTKQCDQCSLCLFFLFVCCVVLCCVFVCVCLGELIGGSQREERLEQLEAKMVEFNLDPKDYWWYNDLRRYGRAPRSSLAQQGSIPSPGQGARSLHPDRVTSVWMQRALATLCVSSACTRNTLHAYRKCVVGVAVRVTPRHTMPPPTPGAWLPSFDLRQVRQRASRGIRPRIRAAGVLRYRRGEHPGRNRFPAFPGQRGVLRHPH